MMPECDALSFRPARWADAATLAPRLRQADQDEMAALSNRSHRVSLQLSLAVSDQPMAILQGADVIALYGIGRSSVLSGTGSPWLLGSDRVDRLARRLLPQSRVVIAGWRRDYPHLVNYVSVRHARSIRWLTWLGFALHPAAPYGAFGNLFHKFEMRSPHV